MRLGFYEGWLSAEGFRDGRLDLAGLYAVFSFLRMEGGRYDAIVRRAGTCAAEWYLASIPATARTVIRGLPPWLRIRWCCRMARRMALETFRETQVSTRWRAGVGRFSIRRSLFCDVRGRASEPLCGYYAALVEQLLREFSTPATVRLAECRATGAEACAIEVTTGPAQLAGSTLGAWFLPLLTAVAVSSAGGALPLRAAPSSYPSASPSFELSIPPESQPGLILVVPFEIEGREARLHWLSEAAAVLLTESLGSQGASVIPRDERLRAFERLQVPPLATLSRATVIRVGQLVGASTVVTGIIRPTGETFSVTSRCIHLGTGRMDAELSAQGGLAELAGVFDRVARGLQLSGTPSSRALEGKARPPLPAFEAYVKGLIAETPAAQLASLKTALSLAPGFDDARLAAWKAYTSAGDHKGALKVLEAVAEASASYADARFLASCSQISLKQYPEALTTLTGLLKRMRSASVLNNIGVVQQRLSAEAAESGGRPTWYFNQARELDPLDGDFVFNLGYAYWAERDAGAATYWLKEAVRLDPADGAAHAVLSQALKVSGATSEAARELELAQQLSSVYEGLTRRPGEADAALRGLARLKDRLGPPHAQRVESTIDAGGQREREELAMIYLDHGRRLVEQERDREAVSELGRAVYLSPYLAEAHLLLGRVYLRTGRLKDAIDELKISLWSDETLAAHLALAEAYVSAKNQAGARSEAQRALAMDPGSTQAKLLLDRLGPPR